MRLVNDREEKAPPAPAELNVGALLAHSIFAAVGIASVFLTPLPMLVAGLRLVDPWPKVAAIIGAVIAILLFEVSPALVTAAFVFGLFVTDGVSRKIPFWQMVGKAALLALGLGGAALVLLAAWNRAGIWQTWSTQVHLSVVQIQTLLQGETGAPLAELEAMLLFEGPFLLISAALISLWVSVGLVAHVGLLEDNSAYNGTALRALRVPTWLSGVFFALFFVMLLPVSALQQFAAGIYRLAATIFFIQGTVCLVHMLDAKKVSHRARTFVYVFAILIGFYVLVGLGALSPWILRKKEIKA